MNENRFIIYSPQETSDYEERLNGFAAASWPEFMLHDPISEKYWDFLCSDFPQFQFSLLDTENNRTAAMANSLPIHWEGKLQDLPEEGWDWVFQKAVIDHQQGIVPNMLCAIQIAIHPDYRGQSISTLMVNKMRNIVRGKGWKTLIAPVRPNQKCLYPLISIDNYIKWKTSEDLPFDAWLRVHARLGARIIKPCHRAMEIKGTISDWEKWTGLRFPESADYVIPGGLVPLQINLENDLGIYIEPNVWMVHEI